MFGRCLTTALVLSLAAPAMAEEPPPQPDYFRQDNDAGERVLFRIDRERSTNDWWLVGGLAGGALVVGATGLLFHLDSKSASDDVSASQFTARTWSPAFQSKYDRSVRSGRIAVVSYGLSGALAVASVVAFLATDPGTEVVSKKDVLSMPYVVPTRGGAFMSKAWSF